MEETGYVTDAERKGYGMVWNPKENAYWKLKNFADVNWRYPHAWVDTERYPNRPHPETWDNYNIESKMDYPVV